MNLHGGGPAGHTIVRRKDGTFYWRVSKEGKKAGVKHHKSVQRAKRSAKRSASKRKQYWPPCKNKKARQQTLYEIEDRKFIDDALIKLGVKHMVGFVENCIGSKRIYWKDTKFGEILPKFFDGMTSLSLSNKKGIEARVPFDNTFNTRTWEELILASEEAILIYLSKEEGDEHYYPEYYVKTANSTNIELLCDVV